MVSKQLMRRLLELAGISFFNFSLYQLIMDLRRDCGRGQNGNESVRNKLLGMPVYFGEELRICAEILYVRKAPRPFRSRSKSNLRRSNLSPNHKNDLRAYKQGPGNPESILTHPRKGYRA